MSGQIFRFSSGLGNKPYLNSLFTFWEQEQKQFRVPRSPGYSRGNFCLFLLLVRLVERLCGRVSFLVNGRALR